MLTPSVSLPRAAQGKLAEAEPLYRAVVRSKQLRFGDTNLETLADMNNLANLLMEQVGGGFSPPTLVTRKTVIVRRPSRRRRPLAALPQDTAATPDGRFPRVRSDASQVVRVTSSDPLVCFLRSSSLNSSECPGPGPDP